jgi:rubrerythrin
MDTNLVQTSIFLDSCQELENLAAELYHLLADQFHDDRETALIWRRTALEEENHALQVTLAKRLIGEIVGVNMESFKSVGGLKEELASLYSRFLAAPPDLYEALSTAIDFEERLERFHMHNAIRLKERPGIALFTAMMNHDRDHVVRLRQLLEELPECRVLAMAAG